MKKLFTTLLCFILAFSMTLMTGCSDEFSGNYVEASADEISTIATQADAVAANSDFNYGAGVSIEYDLSIMEGGLSADIEMDFKAITQDNTFKLKGELEANMPGQAKLSAGLYGDNDYIYLKYKAAGVEIKTKHRMEIDDLIDQYIGISGLGASSELGYYLDLASEYSSENVKFYTDITETTKKVKLEITDGQYGEIEVVMVYDANYKLIASKFEFDLSYEDALIDLSFEMKPWNGSISFPSDLNTYIPSLV